MSASDVVRWIIGICDELSIPCMVVGSFASSSYGVPRTTMDLDVVIDPSGAQLERLLVACDPERFYVDADVARDALRRRSMFNVIDLQTGWKVDLIVRKANAHAVAELARRTTGTVAGVAAPMATAEDVIIAKLEWARASGSERQLADVAGIVRARGAALDHAYLARWIADLGLAAPWAAAQALAAEPR